MSFEPGARPGAPKTPFAASVAHSHLGRGTSSPPDSRLERGAAWVEVSRPTGVEGPSFMHLCVANAPCGHPINLARVKADHGRRDSSVGRPGPISSLSGVRRPPPRAWPPLRVALLGVRREALLISLSATFTERPGMGLFLCHTLFRTECLNS